MAAHLVLGAAAPTITAECPRCKALFAHQRAPVPQFDSSGFESYQLQCIHCGASFAGIIDPYDGELLLSRR